jgi:hypothetical protein
MRQKTVIYLKNAVERPKQTVLTALMNRLGSSRFSRTPCTQHPTARTDPYLLILLAAQEFEEGREQQAKYLIEAAYDAFDGQKNVTHLPNAAGRLSIVPTKTAIGVLSV